MGNLKEDIKLIDSFFNKYQLMPIRVFAKKKGVTRTSVYRWIESGRVDMIVLGGNKFVIPMTYVEL